MIYLMSFCQKSFSTEQNSNVWNTICNSWFFATFCWSERYTFPSPDDDSCELTTLNFDLHDLHFFTRQPPLFNFLPLGFLQFWSMSKITKIIILGISFPGLPKNKWLQFLSKTDCIEKPILTGKIFAKFV